VIVDSHCHLDDRCFDPDRDEVVERAREAGVRTILSIGAGDGPPDLEPAIRMAERYDNVVATVGVHPQEAAKMAPETPQEIERLCSHPKVVAVGEIGLDYYYDHAPRETQREAFLMQMEIARQARKPIIIHTREAWDDTIELLEQHWKPAGLGGVLHCFSGDYEQARRALDAGFLISYGGVLTFRKSETVREAAARLPMDRLLVETDSPYLTPEPYRKIRRNEPKFVVETGKKLAEVLGAGYEELAGRTTGNFDRLFNLPEPS